MKKALAIIFALGLLSGCGPTEVVAKSESPTPTPTAEPSPSPTRSVQPISLAEDFESNPEIILLREAEANAEDLHMITGCQEITGPSLKKGGTISETQCDSMGGTILLFRFGQGTSREDMLEYLRTRGDFYYSFLEDGSGVVTWMSILLSSPRSTGALLYGSGSFPIIARGLGELWCMEVVATGGSYNENKSAPSPCG